jgi:hypothetical protein
MAEYKNNIQVLQLASYVRPDIVEVNSKNWVLNGVNNSFFQYIIDRYNGSPTNSAIIDSYALMIYGFGLDSENENVFNILPAKEIRKVCRDFEMFGMAALEVHYSGNKPIQVFWTDVAKLAPEKANEDGDITGYYYSYDWAKTTKYIPKRMAAFGFGKGSSRVEILMIKDYQVGQFYFSNPGYISALPYAELEEEIANYCINHIKNGLSFGHVVNMNNGQPESEEVKERISQNIRRQLTGSSNAGKLVLSFNDNKETATTVEALQVSDAHQQYQFLSEEARMQICVGHKVVSGAILGINKTTGFSSNAEEIETAFNETMLNVIQPKQEIILEHLKQVLILAGIEDGIEFIPLRKSMNDEAQSGGTTEGDVVKKEASYNGAQISSAIQIIQSVQEGVMTEAQAVLFLVQLLQFNYELARNFFDANLLQKMDATNKEEKDALERLNNPEPVQMKAHTPKDVAEYLIGLGEEIDEEEWELIDEKQMEGEPQLTETALQLARVPSSFPNVESEQDTTLFKIRYQYAGSDKPQRDFCSKMMSAKKVYRKEDIELAGSKVVNPGFGPEGADTYNIWLYKGGANCYHFWMRKVYLRRNNKSISVNEARRIINELDPTERYPAQWDENDARVAKLPIDMPNQGYLNPR